jgi:hypothetical protein
MRVTLPNSLDSVINQACIRHGGISPADLMTFLVIQDGRGSVPYNPAPTVEQKVENEPIAPIKEAVDFSIDIDLDDLDGA